MIKALGYNADTGRTTILFGLSDENWRRMRELNHPIHVDLEELLPGVHASVLIFGDKDEETMVEMFKSVGVINDESVRIKEEKPQ